MANLNRKRGPAVSVLPERTGSWPRSVPLHFKEVDRHKIYDTRRLDAGWFDFWRSTVLDILQIPPVLEQPKLIYNSGFQPIVRWGFRHWNRAHLVSTPRFRERYVLVGHLVKQPAGRRRMQGITTREAGGGYVYVYPQFFTGQRAVQLGGG